MLLLDTAHIWTTSALVSHRLRQADGTMTSTHADRLSLSRLLSFTELLRTHLHVQEGPASLHGGVGGDS